MIVDISPAHNDARLIGTRTFMDLGSLAARIQLFGTTKPTPGADPGGSPLVTVELAKPSSELDSGVLTLVPATLEGELVASTGTVVWARFINGNDDWVMDTDVSIEGGDGAVQLPVLTIYAGGRCPLSTSTIG